jgi:acyl carrier protein
MNTTKRIARFINSQVLQGAPFSGDPLAAGVLDSLGLEQLIAFIEDEFEIRFAEDDLQPEHFAGLDGIVKLVDSKRRAKH